MFTEHTLAEIRTRLDIIELVGEYVQLKKSGQGYMGLCPFHGEKTPSFHVHPLKQVFHCFGCQKGGNIFSFLCAIEGLSFPEAVRRLAKRTGVTIEETSTFRPKTAAPVVENQARLHAAQEWAAKYFHYLLMEVPEYRFAREYLKSRGISEKTIQKFRIGVAPKGWNTLLTLMQNRKFSFEELVQCGLIIPKEGSPTQGYDRFRQRLMFPILDHEGAVIGFGARILVEEDNQPKYINSPESPVFSKRRVLYGLFENQRGVRLKGEAVIVEGYMDVVGLYEAGVHNAIATMGTAMTEEHLGQLRGVTRRVVTVFDPDAAGTDASRRSVHLFIGSGFFAKDLALPDGMDPDEFVLKEGAEKFFALCEKAPRQITKLLKEIAAKGALSEEESSRVLAELTPILVASRRLPDRALLWDDISLLLKVSLSSLKELAEVGAGYLRKEEKKPVTAPSRFTSSSKPGAPRDKGHHPVDLEFFQACVHYPADFRALTKGDWVGGVRDKKILNWLERLHEAPDKTEWESCLEELVHQSDVPDLTQIAAAGLFGERPSEDVASFAAIADRIRKRKQEGDIRALSAQVKLTQRLGDDEEQLRLLEKLKELRSSLSK